MTARFSGSGPGVRTADGCSVELYRRLPYLGELDDHRAWFGPGTTVLDLGCGTGRLAERMRSWGANVVAVDQSVEMLAAVPPGIRTVCGDIATLVLDDRFDVVLLASGLVNHPDERVRAGLVRTARRHLAPGGRLLLQRQPVDWLRERDVGRSGHVGAMEVAIEAIEPTAHDAWFVTLRYGLDDLTWRQSFDIVALDETAIEALLARHGFGGFAWSGARRVWVEASAAEGDPRNVIDPRR